MRTTNYEKLKQQFESFGKAKREMETPKKKSVPNSLLDSPEEENDLLEVGHYVPDWAINSNVN